MRVLVWDLGTWAISCRATILSARRIAATSDGQPYSSLIRSIACLSCGVSRIVVGFVFMPKVYLIDICIASWYTCSLRLRHPGSKGERRFASRVLFQLNGAGSRQAHRAWVKRSRSMIPLCACKWFGHGGQPQGACQMPLMCRSVKPKRKGLLSEVRWRLDTSSSLSRGLSI
jgi:hypothetical protein